MEVILTRPRNLRTSEAGRPLQPTQERYGLLMLPDRKPPSGAFAHEVTVTASTINTTHRSEVLVSAQARDRGKLPEYGCRGDPTHQRSPSTVCGALRRTESSTATLPSATLDNLVVDGLHCLNEAVQLFLRLRLSRLNHQRAGTGNAKVGAWKPKSIRRLQTSSAVT